MKRLAKIIAIIVAILIVLVIVAAIVLPFVFDPNEHKAEITHMIEHRIGRQVSIPGDIKLSVFPWLGVSIGKVTVANAPGFGDKPMAEIGDAEASVRVLPLLHGDVEIGKVTLDGLRLRLARNSKGRSNWDSIVEHMNSTHEGEAENNKAPAKKPESGESGGLPISSLQIGSVKVSDATVVWNDAASGQSYKLSDVHLSTGTLADGQPLDIKAGATLDAPTQGMAGKLTVTTTIDPNFSKGIYKLSDLKTTLNAHGDAIPGGKQTMTLAAHGLLDMEKGALALKDIDVQLADLEVSGAVSGTGLNKTPAFTGHFAVAQFNPRKVMDSFGMSAPKLEDSKALRSAKASVEFSASSGQVQIKPLQVTLDDSQFKGSAAVSHFSKPVVKFDAKVDQFNLDRYLPVAGTQKTAGQSSSKGKSSGGSSGTTEKIDLSFLKGPTVDGQLHIGKLQAYNMAFNDAKLAIALHKGVLTIKPLSSGFYDGKINMEATVNASHSTPKYALQADLSNLKFAPLLKDLVGTEMVSALANMKLDLTSSGDTVDAIKKALNGKVSFKLSDGTLYGFNLAQFVTTARNQLAHGSTKQPKAKGDKTPFSHLDGTFHINNGEVSGKGLELATKYLNAVGKGKYNLLANNLDYTVDLHVDEKDAGPLKDVAGLSIPLHLSGSLLSPKYSVDMESLLQGLAQQKLDDQKSKLKDKLRDKLEQKLGKKDKASDTSGGKGSKKGSDKDELKKKLREGLSNLLGG